MRFMAGVLASLVCAMVPVWACAQDNWEFGADLGFEVRSFFEEPRFPDQFDTFQPSLILNGDVRFRSDTGRHQVVFVPFARLDGQDEERTHVDLREGYYRYVGDDFEVLVGAAKVFWGVTESRHLVDIINQTDGVEDIDEEDKLGQPMVSLSLIRDWGKLDLFILPRFRIRTFPGSNGRLRFDPIIAADDPLFEDADGRWNTDFAVRYSHVLGEVDFGVSFFSGTSREPLFVPAVSDGGSPVFRPLYTKINQLGTDIQYTKDAWLFKFEGILREGQGDVFPAMVAGFEYTFFGVTQSGADLGVLMEYLYDDRSFPEAPVTVQDNDLFYGARYALNDIQDTSILAGFVTDLKDGSTSGLVEAERRLGQNWTGELEARFFVGVDDRNILSAFSQDSVLTARLTRYF